MTLSFIRAKFRKTDILFSQFIRTRDEWRCQYCGKQYTPPTRGLHNSHFYGRGHENTRFDPENCDALCAYCHDKLEGGPNNKLYDTWKLRQLGQRRYDLLAIRAQTYKKRDDIIDLIIINQLLKEQNG